MGNMGQNTYNKTYLFKTKLLSYCILQFLVVVIGMSLWYFKHTWTDKLGGKILYDHCMDQQNMTNFSIFLNADDASL